MIRYIKENNENIIEIPLECIKDATLLSKKEYEKYKDIIPYICQIWWLRSIGSYEFCVCGVNLNRDVYSYCNVEYNGIGIRPALILNLQASNLNISDKFLFGGYTFTILSKDLAICDDFIGKSYFRESCKAPDANVYEKSDIKKIVDYWFREACSNKGFILKSDEEIWEDESWGF